MPASLGSALILDEARARAEGDIITHGVDHIFDVAIAVIHIDHDRQARGMKNVARRGVAFGKMREIDIRHAMAGPCHGKSADLHGGEPRLLDQPRSQGVVGDRQEQGMLARERCAPAESVLSHMLDALLKAGSRPSSLPLINCHGWSTLQAEEL